MESANKYDAEASLSTSESYGELENGSNDNFYQLSPNGEMFSYSNMFHNNDYNGLPFMDYGYIPSLFVPYGYYDFDGNFCGNFNHLSNDFKEVSGTEYYTPNFNLSMHPSSGCPGTDENLMGIEKYGEDLTSWKPEIEEPYYNGYSDLEADFQYGLTNEGEAQYFQTSDAYALNLNSNCFGNGNLETTYYSQPGYTFPYVWYPSEVPSYYYDYETNGYPYLTDFSSKN